jgi:hypothetical protein
MTTEFKTWMRVCSITHEGMNAGWVTEDAGKYFKNIKDAVEWSIAAGYANYEDAYADDAIYWTDWADSDDEPQAVEFNGKMYHG